MIRRELVDAISDLNFWGRPQDTGKAREGYLEKLQMLLEANDMITSIIGVRKAGKTVLSKQLLAWLIETGKVKKEQTLYVNFEEPSFRPYLGDPAFLKDLYDSYRYHLNQKDRAIVVMDEVQNVDNWEGWARILLESKENAKLIVTGSSAKLLGRELATKLTGRTLTSTVFPLSFGEFIRFRSSQPEKEASPKFKGHAMEMLFREYLELGGFPLVALTERRELKLMILKALFDDLIIRDIVERHEIRSPEMVKSLATLAIQNFSGYVSVAKLINIFQTLTKRKISPTTVNRYLGFFSEAFLLFLVPVFAPKVKEQLLYPRKCYCIDNGLIYATAFRLSEDLGALAENLVFIELMRHQAAGAGMEIFYWRARGNGREVDFVIKKGTSIHRLIQVCWNIDGKCKKRETDALLEAMDDFGLKNGLLLSENREGEGSFGDRMISYVPLWKFLMDSRNFL